VEDFARHVHRVPEHSGQGTHPRRSGVSACKNANLGVRTVGVRSVGLHTAALRFFACKTLKRGPNDRLGQ